MSTESRISAAAESSRRNGARSRGPKPRAQGALGAERTEARATGSEAVVLPDEHAAEFSGLEAALLQNIPASGHVLDS
jgi:hypothetical protein